MRFLFKTFALACVISCLYSCAAGRNHDQPRPQQTRAPAHFAEPPSPTTHPSLFDYWQFAIVVPDLESAAAFYERIGFEEVGRGTEPSRYLILSDGVAHLRLEYWKMQFPWTKYEKADLPFAAPRLMLFSPDLVGNVGDPEKCFYARFGGLMIGQGEASSSVMGYEGASGAESVKIRDPNGLRIWGSDWPHPAGPAGVSHCKLGQFIGLVVPLKYAEVTAGYWRRGWFDVSESPAEEAVKRIDARHGDLLLRFRETRSLQEPAMLYSSPDVVKRIAELKQMGFDVGSEAPNAKGDVDRAALVGPGNLVILLGPS